VNCQKPQNTSYLGNQKASIINFIKLCKGTQYLEGENLEVVGPGFQL